MKIGVLTSSRADFGIYQPLLFKLKDDSSFDLKIIAFGSHLSHHYGYTIEEIYNAGLNNIDELKTLLASDDDVSVATSYGLTVLKFTDYWSNNFFDLVLCLGDRYEMSAAVQAGIPFGVKFGHLHGGEKTLGAIDNIYRHQITLASKLHFTSTEDYKRRVISLLDNNKHVYNVGAMGLDGIHEIDLPDQKTFRDKYDIPAGDYALVTIHPETVHPEKNKLYVEEIFSALHGIANNFNLVITMPNADTQGSIYRNKIKELKKQIPEKVCIVGNFGRRNYFTAMKYSEFLLGNTSSGIIEAASFNKYVINIGDRQKGRSQSGNIINCDFRKDDIIEAVKKVKDLHDYTGTNIYHKENTAEVIKNILKKLDYEAL